MIVYFLGTDNFKRQLSNIKSEISFFNKCSKFIHNAIVQESCIDHDNKCKSSVCISTMKQFVNTVQKWIQCSNCGNWWHLECSFVSTNTSISDSWCCLACSKAVTDANTLLAYVKLNLEQRRGMERNLQIKIRNLENGIKEAENVIIEKQGQCATELLKSLKILKVDLQSYHSGSFVGNHVFKILQKSHDIDGPLIITTCLSSQPKLRNEYYNLLSILSSIFNLTNVARFLNDAEIQQLEELCSKYEQFCKNNSLNNTVTIKSHMLMKHVVPFAKRFKTVGLFSEQSIESMHNFMNQIHRRYNIRSSERAMMLAFQQQSQIKLIKNKKAFMVEQ